MFTEKLMVKRIFVLISNGVISGRLTKALLMGLLALVTVSLSLGLLPTSKAFAAGLDAAWVHGTSLNLQQPTNVTMDKYGWGSHLTLPAGYSGSVDAWVHIALPTPVVEDGVRSYLNQVLISHRGNAVIDAVHVWDGTVNNPMAVWATGDHTAYGAWTAVALPTPKPNVLFGIGLSIHVRNYCVRQGDFAYCSPQWLEINSAGGDFYN